MAMKVAVTGGSGQLGTLVLRRLVDDRRVQEVVSLDVRPPLVASGKLRAVRADVREPDLDRHFAGCEAVVHLAFMLAQHAERSLVDSVNVEGSKNVFRAAATAGARTIVYSSSVAAYGIVPGHPQPLVESSPRVFRPDFAYTANKFQVEEFLDDFEPQNPEIAIARLRPTVLVGRGMDHVLGLALRVRRIPDTGKVPLPLVWDEDVASAVLLALAKRARGAFNVTADEALPAAELAKRTGTKLLAVPLTAIRTWARLTPALEKLRLARRADPAWLDTLPPMVASSERAKTELGWKPVCPTNVAVIERLKRVVPCAPDPRIVLFLYASAFAVGRGHTVVDLGGFDTRVHLCLTGPRGGDFTISVKDRKLGVSLGAPRPPTATITLAASFLVDLLAGRADVASAEITGKLRVSGEGHAALLFGGMITGFRTAVSAERAGRRTSWALARLLAS
jgi:nucleoside-diphosphate-sugar epimerase